LRGLVKRLHGRIAYVSYDIQPRKGGETKYSLRKMLSLAWNGVTSFSIVPLRLIAAMGWVDLHHRQRTSHPRARRSLCRSNRSRLGLNHGAALYARRFHPTFIRGGR